MDKNNAVGLTGGVRIHHAGETGTAMVIPGHWDMFADNSEDPQKFADYLDVKYGRRIRCVIPKVSESIQVSV